eukprot:Nitzschia sp. Nitz4//scaffold49_size126201//147//2059//NITZ4_003625-RA/size126201-snap-gene-0.48-mRNA-1//1//CDS//3329553098//2506//frame0
MQRVALRSRSTVSTSEESPSIHSLSVYEDRIPLHLEESTRRTAIIHDSQQQQQQQAPSPLRVTSTKRFPRRRKKGVQRSRFGQLMHRITQQFCPQENKAQFLSLLLAVALWYTLGIVSISTSKVLLRSLSPLWLTAQQFTLGSLLLRFLLYQRVMGATDGLVSWETMFQGIRGRPTIAPSSTVIIPLSAGPSSWMIQFMDTLRHGQYLVQAGVCFSLGFFATNQGFGGASASFVETIKAAEPITSAILAVSYGLERLSGMEQGSLVGIVVGVLLSTLGNVESTSSSSSLSSTSSTATSTPAGSWTSFYSCAWVMLSNLSFSFRGLFQKWWMAQLAKTTNNVTNHGMARVPSWNGLVATTTSTTTTTTTTTATTITTTGMSSSTPATKTTSMDDLNLQFRMQQVGVILFGIPALLSAWMSMMDEAVQELPLVGSIGGGGGNNGNNGNNEGVQQYGWLLYGGLILINGMAFTSYNLASTYLLSRISVVHHAALNCIRRIFAILMTSLIFQVPMTLLGGFGIVVSFGSFVMFSKAKAAKATAPKKGEGPLPLHKKDLEAATK